MATTEQNPKSKPAHPPHDEGCPVKMYNGKRCGRDLYSAVHPGDVENVCLMHTHDPNKDVEAFQGEFERTLGNAADGLADFSGFVFPPSYYRDRTFKMRCVFERAEFIGHTSFENVTFAQDADFSWAEFVLFASFAKSKFTRGATFLTTRFLKGAGFGGATFTCDVDFVGATFELVGYFLETKFLKGADFSAATFTGEANFEKAWFQEAVKFMETNFESEANFTKTVFTLEADFSAAKFQGRTIFRETQFPADPERPGPIFTLTRFEKPEAVNFENTCLAQALFHKCDLSRVSFSDVEWRQRKNRKWTVYDEEVDLKHPAAKALVPEFPGWAAHDERNYLLIAETYQQLKKNYDDRRDYWTAGDFHYGEMEMKRLASRRRDRLLRWCHRNMGLVAWYKYASEYGENYVRPVPWLGFFLFVFMLAYPIAGLRLSEAARKSSAVGAIHESPLRKIGTAQPTSPPGVSDVTYRRFFQFVNDHPRGRACGALAFFVHSFVAALDVAFFQKTPEYEPSTTLGHVLTLVELLLTSTLIALFLLAVRRQFRR